MPTYTVRDPQTGRSVKLTGDSPPTEAELTDIFAKLGSPVDGKPPAAATAGMKPQSSATPPTDGYFEDLPGAQGQRWHPPAGSGRELDRPDNSILGLPPELAVVAGAGIAKGAVSAGLQGASRAYGGAKAAMGQAVPLVKYEVAKSALQAAGVPPGWATVAAGIFAGSGGKGRPSPRAKAPAAAKAPVAAPAATPAPVQAGPAVAANAPAVAPTAAPVASTAAPVRAGWSPSGMSPQRIQNELGLAARRSGAKLTEPQYNEAAELVIKGATPLDAVKSVAGSAPAKAVTASKPRISGAEVREYTRLRGMGKTDAEAKASIEQQRAFAAKFSTPTSEDVRSRVAERNATGRWQ